MTALATADIREATEGNKYVAAIVSANSPLGLVEAGLDNGLSANSAQVGPHMLNEAMKRVEVEKAAELAAEAVANTNEALPPHAMATYVSSKGTGVGGRA